jgi:hypothetical protein
MAESKEGAPASAWGQQRLVGRDRLVGQPSAFVARGELRRVAVGVADLHGEIETVFVVQVIVASRHDLLEERRRSPELIASLNHRPALMSIFAAWSTAFRAQDISARSSHKVTSATASSHAMSYRRASRSWPARDS